MIHKLTIARAAAWVLVAGLLAATSSPAVAGPAEAWLSWSAGERLTSLPALEGADSAVYLTVETEQPIDSLGFRLRWATGRPDAVVRVVALRPVDLASGEGAGAWLREPGDTEMSGRRFDPLDRWLSDPGVLDAMREPLGEGGRSRYRLAVGLACERVGSAILEAQGLTVRYTDGRTERLTDPAVSVGEGGRLRHPPLIAGIEGAINRRYLQSTLHIFGADLDRVAELRLVDVAGQRRNPIRIVSRSPEYMDLTFANRTLSMGPARLFYRDPDCTADSIAAAVAVTVLEERQPEDTNAGVVPGREE